MVDIALLIFQALWLIWPAYCANAFPVVMKGKKPLDFNKRLGKERLLGKSKTIEGTVGGIAIGILIGLLQIQIHPFFPEELGLMQFTLSLIIALSVGALFGDIIGSFIKRRLGIQPGKKTVPLDQLDFLVFALIFAGFFVIIDMKIIITLVVLTPPIHLITNFIGHSAKLKKRPW